MKPRALMFSFIPLLLVAGVMHLDAQDAAISSTPRDQLQQLTAQLQKSPDDQALREKIIAMALTLNPKPATPDAAIMAEGAAEYAFKNAKVNSDFSDAAKQYEKALLLAPWLATDYFNCGVAHERGGENKEAISSFGFYLLTSPGAEDALVVKKRIGGLQYAAQKTAETAKEQASAADEQARAAARLVTVYQGLDGGVWTLYGINQDSNRPLMGGSVHNRVFIEIHGHQIEMYPVDDINGRMGDAWNVHLRNGNSTHAESGMSGDVKISDDGQSIILDGPAPNRPRWYFHRTK